VVYLSRPLRGQLVFGTGILGLLSVPVFKQITGLPPYLGMLAALVSVGVGFECPYRITQKPEVCLFIPPWCQIWSFRPLYANWFFYSKTLHFMVYLTAIYGLRSARLSCDTY
jgi:hypothetical protein